MGLYECRWYLVSVTWMRRITCWFFIYHYAIFCVINQLHSHHHCQWWRESSLYFIQKFHWLYCIV